MTWWGRLGGCAVYLVLAGGMISAAFAAAGLDQPWGDWIEAAVWGWMLADEFVYVVLAFFFAYLAFQWLIDPPDMSD